MDTTYDALKKEVPPCPETHTHEVLITLVCTDVSSHYPVLMYYNVVLLY